MARTRSGQSAEVRTANDRVWVRVGEGPWSEVDGGGPALASAGTEWGSLFSGLTFDPSALPGQPLVARHHGDPARVWVDTAGRIRRIEIDGSRVRVRFDLSGFGAPIDVTSPMAAGP